MVPNFPLASSTFAPSKTRDLSIFLQPLCLGLLHFSVLLDLDFLFSFLYRAVLVFFVPFEKPAALFHWGQFSENISGKYRENVKLKV